MTENAPNPSPAPSRRDAGPEESPTSHRWIRESLSAQQMADRLKTLAWVIPLSLLIWVYAEREQLVSPEPTVVPIEVKSSAGTHILRLESPADKNLMVKPRGPQGRLQQLQRQLPPNGPGLVIEMKPPAVQGLHTMAAIELLRQQPAFAGVEIVEVRPLTVRIQVDEVREVTAEVVWPESVTNLEPTTSFEPRQVKVSGPRSVIDEWERTWRNRFKPGEKVLPLQVAADIETLPVLQVPGAHEMEVAVRPPPGLDDVAVAPANVKAELRVRPPDTPFTIDSVPVFVQLPDTMQKYRVEWVDMPPAIVNVKVKGPPRQIEALQADGGGGKYKAVLEITPTMTEGEVYTRSVEVQLPEGIRLAPTDKPYSVTFRLVPKAE